MFLSSQIKLSQRITLHFISIENYSVDLLNHIKLEVAKIWNGDLDAEDDLSVIRLELQDLFRDKDDRKKHGLVSEFICHLYLRSQNFEQHFLFRNLEEKGMKKGFDGIYLNEGDYWIYESKSTLETTEGATHNDNVSKAYNDLKKKVEGKNVENNPWKNAYTHAGNSAISINDTLVQTLKKFSVQYTKKQYHQISKFNVVPSSTIYLGARWYPIPEPDLKDRLSKLTNKYDCKKLAVLCINKKSIEDFINFING